MTLFNTTQKRKCQYLWNKHVEAWKMLCILLIHLLMCLTALIFWYFPIFEYLHMCIFHEISQIPLKNKLLPLPRPLPHEEIFYISRIYSRIPFLTKTNLIYYYYSIPICVFVVIYEIIFKKISIWPPTLSRAVLKYIYLMPLIYNEFIKYTALVLNCCNRLYFLVIYFLEVIEFLKF